ELGELIRLLKEAMDSNKTHILSSVNGLSNSSIASNVIILLIMVGMTYVLTRLICGPLKLVVEQANAIATGDLSSDIDRKAIGNDELGELADATTKMQDDLRQVIDNVIAAVTQLSSA
ncbi:methyl-accepting chemotaxis protein, partial [Vibrio parahaemolyticus]